MDIYINLIINEPKKQITISIEDAEFEITAKETEDLINSIITKITDLIAL